MNRLSWLLLALACAACERAERELAVASDSDSVVQEPAPGADAPVDGSVIAPDSVAPLETLVASHDIDVDGDGADETVGLWVAAASDARGRIMFDDGQRWLLAVEDDGALQPLFEDRIQLGGARFWIYEPDDGGPPAILLLRDLSAGFVLERFTFDRARGAFVRAVAYQMTGNRRYVSPDPGVL